MQFRANEKLRTERMTECRACEHYNKEHGTCGTPRWLKPQGDTVTHYRSKRKLCGCKMSLKVQLPWSSCPLGKWKGNVSPDQMKRIVKYVKTVEGKSTFYPDDLKLLYEFMSLIAGKHIPVSNCASCVKDAIKELRLVANDAEGM